MTNKASAGNVIGAVTPSSIPMGPMTSTSSYGISTSVPVSVASGGSGSSYVYSGGAPPTKLRVTGDVEITGDIIIKGVSLSETLDKIQERLNILVPNQELESDWEELAELRRKYVELERELLEKQKTFSTLRKP